MKTRADVIKAVFISGIRPHYVAASMYVDSTPADYCSHLDKNITPEERYWLSLSYLKFKKSTNKELNDIAMNYVLSFSDDQKAKHLLLVME